MSQAKEGGVSLPLEPASARQDPSFYTNDAGLELVWADFTTGEEPRFRVYRNGEMRIHARHSLDTEYQVIRYTDQLESFGIKTDADLYEWDDKGAEYFDVIDNSWFEVFAVNESDEEWSEVYFDLALAVDRATEMWEKYGKHDPISE
jgi:hypothetical protein